MDLHQWDNRSPVKKSDHRAGLLGFLVTANVNPTRILHDAADASTANHYLIEDMPASFSCQAGRYSSHI
jgi:hypothetical protein